MTIMETIGPKEDGDKLKIIWVGGDMDGSAAQWTRNETKSWEEDRQNFHRQTAYESGQEYYLLDVIDHHGLKFYVYYTAGKTKNDVLMAIERATSLPSDGSDVEQVLPGNCTECGAALPNGGVFMSIAATIVCQNCVGLPVTLARLEQERLVTK